MRLARGRYDAARVDASAQRRGSNDVRSAQRSGRSVVATALCRRSGRRLARENMGLERDDVRTRRKFQAHEWSLFGFEGLEVRWVTIDF